MQTGLPLAAHNDPDAAQLNRIGTHAYWLPADERTDRPVLGAVCGERGSLVVDAGNSAAHAQLFLRVLSCVPVAPPRFLAVTHWHWDHVFGIHTFGLPTFASTSTQRIVAEMARLDWSDEALDRRVAEGSEIAFCRDNIKAELPDRTSLIIRPPDIAFDGDVTVDLGGVTCRLLHVGGDHAAGSIVVHVPEDRVAFIGDCLGEDIYNGAPRYTTAALFPLLERLLACDVDCYLFGHGDGPSPRVQMEADAALLRKIGTLVDRLGPDRLAVLEAMAAALAKPVEADHLEIVDAFLAGLAKPGRR